MLDERIDAILELPLLGALVAKYFDASDSCPFAGTTFDTLGTNDPDRFQTDDLLAASLLDVRFSPPAVRRLIVRSEFDSALTGIDADRPIWTIDDELLERLDGLRSGLVDALPGVGTTKASKLLARKRPDLAPIQDSVVKWVLRLEPDSRWQYLVTALAAALDDPSRRSRLEGASPKGIAVSPLRILDVSLWMLGSNSRNARRARASIDLAPEPWRVPQ